MFKAIKENVSAEIVEKKSKFIANIFYVETREEAENIIKDINKEYHDARHNCYAYRIIENGQIVQKASDDGEPSGTAGAPMLNIISKKNLNNILVVVTRYFGGILLGTGGLVKAYSSAVTKALENASIVDKCEAKMYLIEIPYADLSKIKYIADKYDIKILKEEFSTNIYLEIAVKDNKNIDKILEKEINVNKKEFLKEIYV